MDILVILEDSNGELHRMSKKPLWEPKIGGSISAGYGDECRSFCRAVERYRYF